MRREKIYLFLFLFFLFLLLVSRFFIFEGFSS
ncbi:hypothetical protein, unlikely [Trypanosoma brucei gambiense DAL972]|uniref:Uncharacterized protein n=2 Tax=Trypanosoma brucei TaxID=5691 RepID=C9ZHY6_TRYB9|nr:hypothetical protein, unlikely [Trypanosoma brucei gambiense DAL972]RHW74260.1 hypothetical protein DPX39_010041000 [Trypanosoma brucei equiperdum]CBH09103.1 hypothetical protein, unlikely [Trypanosoma brucei gambiense DAL972]|eukprot:XP_011771544.1 hypothetical protein, unlikely [Trypanosoma brucei gambiense DAL972]